MIKLTATIAKPKPSGSKPTKRTAERVADADEELWAPRLDQRDPQNYGSPEALRCLLLYGRVASVLVKTIKTYETDIKCINKWSEEVYIFVCAK